MSQVEILRAESEVQQSRVEFDQALDRLHEEVDGAVKQVQELRDRAQIVYDKVKDPKAIAAQFNNELQQFVGNSLKDASAQVETFTARTKSLLTGIFDAMDNRPWVTWSGIFLAGFLVGPVAFRQISRLASSKEKNISSLDPAA